MFTIKKTTLQAIALLIFLDKRRDIVTSCERSAEFLGGDTKPASVSKILQALARNDVLKSQPGRKGGYWFTRPLTQITLTEIEGCFACDVSTKYISSDERANSTLVVENFILDKFKQCTDNITISDIADFLRVSIQVKL